VKREEEGEERQAEAQLKNDGKLRDPKN